jgi:spermidine synthase
LLSDVSLEPEPRKEEVNGTDRPAYPRHILNIILIVYSLSGFCALAYEVLWTRALASSLGTSTYAFTTMLTTFLLGLALGSLIFARFLDKGKHLLILLAFLEVFIGLFALLSIWEFGKLGELLNNSYIALGESWNATVVTRYIGSSIIMLIPTLLMGIAFPLVNKIYIRNLEGISHGIGNVYSLNTLGSVVGSFMAGFVLIPFIGITKSILLIASINLALGAIVLFSGSAVLVKNRLPWATSVAVVSVAVMVTTIVSPSMVLQKVYFGDSLTYYNEGASATVAVVQKASGLKELMVNGLSEVPTSYDALRAFHMLGHLPCLLHKNPQKALMISFGAGITSGAAAKHPLVQIDVVEISPEVIEANKYFLDENQDILADTRVNLIIEDGRNYLLRTRNQYDVIACDATHPTSSDSWILYTREFYELCRKRLNPDGVACQWLPIHGLDPVDYAMTIKTFQTVFPDTTLWFTNEYVLLVGTKKELMIDFTLLAQRLQDKEIREDLEEFNLGDPFAFLSSFMMSKESIAKYTERVQINTDNRPFIQFGERRSETSSILQILSDLSGSMETVFPLLTNMGKEANAVKTKLQRYAEAGKHVIRGKMFHFQGVLEEQIDEYHRALAINPEDNNAEHLLELAEAKLKLSYLTFGLRLNTAGRLEDAVLVYRTLLQIDPNYVRALHNLAVIYSMKAEYIRAIEELRKAITIDPDYIEGRYLLAKIFAERGRYKEAETQLREILRINPDFEPARFALEKLKD